MKDVQVIRNALRSALSVKEGVHATSRVLFANSIADLALDYINQKEEGHHLFKMEGLLDEFRHHTTSFSAKRVGYRYGGGNAGKMETLFSFSDAFAYSFKMKDGMMEVVSISKYDLPHFICDHFDTDAKCEPFIDWICSSPKRTDAVVKDICGSRFSHLWMEE